MKPGFEIESSGELQGSDSEPGSGDSDGSDKMDRCNALRVRASEANGFSVYTRSKRLRSSGVGRAGQLGEFRDELGTEAVSSNGKVVAGSESNFGVKGGGSEVGMMEIQAKEEEPTVRRFKGSKKVFKSEDHFEMEGSPEAREMQTSKKKRLPTTVRELFETGLLEGYPVVYNGGKRGFPLQGIIKDAGILCSCSLCKGDRIVPPCQFEIHACKVYRRASQYICLENGKSLLDVVKACRKSSVKTFEETIQNIIGPLHAKESATCSNCNGSFLATSAAKVELLCDSCVIIQNSEIGAECVKSSHLEPLLGSPMPENGEVHFTPKKKGRRGKKKRKHSELTNHTSTGKSSVRVATRVMSQRMIANMSSKQDSLVKSPESISMGHSDSTSNGSTSMHGSPKVKTTRNIIKRLSNTTSLSKVVESGFQSAPLQSKSPSKITKKDQRMHKLVFENGGLPDGTEVAYYSNGKLLRDGYKMGSGIICSCCSTLVSPSQFEAHAGWASRRKPYIYIYTSNGVSLHEFAVSLLKGRKRSSNDNDDLCTICADGGKLVLCDGCPRAFHKECASLSSIPRGKWYCTYCQNMFQRERFVEWNANAVAAGRVSGTDPIEQIRNRCIRHVKSPAEAEVIACVICRGYDFSKSGFGPRTVILCDQCEREYHVGCLKKSKMADLKELPKGKWFCSGNCKWIYSTLQNLLNAGVEKIPDSYLELIKKKQIEMTSVVDNDVDVRWRLLNGKITSRETRLLLSQAVAIFHDSFDPIVDSETGRDFIPSLVYGRNIRGRDFSGMYCAILTVNSIVVSAGIVRIFGQEVAELPLAATRSANQGKGYFQILYSCIEKLLAFLNVKSLVLPATDDAKSIWTDKFGFEKIPQEQLSNYRKICWQMITFKGTSMLEKPVPKSQSLDHKGC